MQKGCAHQLKRGRFRRSRDDQRRQAFIARECGIDRGYGPSPLTLLLKPERTNATTRRELEIIEACVRMIWPTCHKIYAGLLDSVDLLYRGEADGPPKTSESPDAKPGGQSLAKAASGG